MKNGIIVVVLVLESSRPKRRQYNVEGPNGQPVLRVQSFVPRCTISRDTFTALKHARCQV